MTVKKRKGKRPAREKAPAPPIEGPQPRGRSILIIGVDESERDSLVEMVLKGNRNLSAGMTFAKLPDLAGLGFRQFEAKRSRFHREFSRLLERGGNIVVSGNLVTATSLGFAPLLTQEQFRPDLTILLEIDARDAFVLPGYGLVRRKSSRRDVKVQQELNRYYATHFSRSLTILRVERENVKKALRELRELMQAVLKG